MDINETEDDIETSFKTSCATALHNVETLLILSSATTLGPEPQTLFNACRKGIMPRPHDLATCTNWVSALHGACIGGHSKIVKVIIQNSIQRKCEPDPDVYSSCLHWAIYYLPANSMHLMNILAALLHRMASLRNALLSYPKNAPTLIYLLERGISLVQLRDVTKFDEFQCDLYRFKRHVTKILNFFLLRDLIIIINNYSLL